jgi:hypothetical protein
LAKREAKNCKRCRFQHLRLFKELNFIWSETGLFSLH